MNKVETTTRSAELYARAGVPEYWVVNLVDRCIEVRTLPVDGAYTKLDTFTPGASSGTRICDCWR